MNFYMNFRRFFPEQSRFQFRGQAFLEVAAQPHLARQREDWSGRVLFLHLAEFEAVPVIFSYRSSNIHQHQTLTCWPFGQYFLRTLFQGTLYDLQCKYYNLDYSMVLQINILLQDKAVIFRKSSSIFKTKPHMKRLFFEKGQKLQLSPNGQFLIETSNNLDSKKYNLVRIPVAEFQKHENYIQSHFYFVREDNLISYFNCWKETQNVPLEKSSAKQKDKKKDKKGMLDVMKRKTKTPQSQHVIAPSKKKILEQSQAENYTIQQFVYVQMEYFSQIQIPNDLDGIRDLMAVIYLLAKKVQKKTGTVPCLIPLKNEQNDRIKFYKKGESLQIQLYRLMIYLLRDKQEMYLREWSQIMQKAIHKAQINREYELVGSLLRNSIEQYIKKPHSICFVNQEEKICSSQTVKIIDNQTIKLEQCQIQLPLDEYKIQYLLKSQSDREITLTHEFFQEYTLSGNKTNFIVKWLYHMAT